ncbi:hypothetical protein Tco_1244542 [Tanacetum coccineum]
MLDLEDSTVTYTAVSSLYGGLSDIGSPGVDGSSVMPEDLYAYVIASFKAPPSSDYVPCPEEPLAPLPLDFVLEPIYPEFMPVEDESDHEEDPEEDDEDPEEDPVDYPTDRDDDDKEEEEETSGDDADDEDEDEDEAEEEEDHPAPADSVPPIYRMTDRISIRAKPSISLPPREEVERLLALTTLPPSPLTPLSSPLPHIHSPPLPVPPPVPILPPSLPTSPTYQLGYRVVMILLRAKALFTSHTPPLGTPPLLPIPDPILSPPVLLSSIDRRADRPEVCLPPRKRLCFTHRPRYEVGESSSATPARPTRGGRVDYRFIGTMDDAIRVEALVKDMQYRYETARLLDQEALVSREAWGCSMEESDYDFRDGSITDSRPYLTGASCIDFDIDVVTTGIGDHSTGIGDSTARTAGTLWRSKTAGCIRGGR